MEAINYRMNWKTWACFVLLTNHVVYSKCKLAIQLTLVIYNTAHSNTTVYKASDLNQFVSDS